MSQIIVSGLRDELRTAIEQAELVSSYLQQMDAAAGNVETYGQVLTGDGTIMTEGLVKVREVLTSLHRNVVLDSYIRFNVERIARGE